MKNTISVILLLLLATACERRADMNKYLKGELERRRGGPELFTINKQKFSAKNFREELYFERKQIYKKFPPPAPRELERALQNYIEETIILQEASVNIDLNSPDARAYLRPYIRKAVISYYLSRKSGEFDLNKNYRRIRVPEKLLEEYYRTRKNKFKKEKIPEKEFKKRLLNTAIHLKWKKMHEAANRKKKLIIGTMKKNNKVKIVPRSLYTTPQ